MGRLQAPWQRISARRCRPRQTAIPLSARFTLRQSKASGRSSSAASLAAITKSAVNICRWTLPSFSSATTTGKIRIFSARLIGAIGIGAILRSTIAETDAVLVVSVQTQREFSLPDNRIGSDGIFISNPRHVIEIFSPVSDERDVRKKDLAPLKLKHFPGPKTMGSVALPRTLRPSNGSGWTGVTTNLAIVSFLAQVFPPLGDLE